MKAFENHQRREGQTVSHGTAKELLAALAVIIPSSTISMTDFRGLLLTVSLKRKVSVGSIGKSF